MGKRVSPDRIIEAVDVNFKSVLSKPGLKTLALVAIAISLAKKLKINEIARHMPADVSHQKCKQTRLLRFLSRPLPLLDMMSLYSRFVLQKVYGKTDDAIIVLIDGTDLIHGFKSFVAAIPYRKRAIPLMFKAYTNQQIRDMIYLSENWIVWNFMDQAYETIQKVFPGRRVMFVFDRGFADEKLIRYLKHMGAHHVMRVPKNSGIEAFEYRGKLASFGQWGYFRNVSYHLGNPIQMNLFCGEDTRMNKDKDDPAFIISDMDDLSELIFRKRMQIEEGFRDLKTLFGFRHLVLKKPTQERVEMMFLLVIITMGLLFVLFEKSGYRWAKYFNTSCRKEFSLIHVIKDRISDSWTNLRISPRFTLSDAVFYCVQKN
jgi:hypothetical protein